MSMLKWFRKRLNSDSSNSAFVPDAKFGHHFAAADGVELQNEFAEMDDQCFVDVEASVNGSTSVLQTSSDSSPVLTTRMGIDDQPLVARSTPRGARYDQKDVEQWHKTHDLRNCLFDQAVYDAIIADCINACQILKNNLDGYIDEVRHSPGPVDQTTNQSPMPVSYPYYHGHSKGLVTPHCC